jgi:hypothetical protein
MSILDGVEIQGEEFFPTPRPVHLFRVIPLEPRAYLVAIVKNRLRVTGENVALRSIGPLIR